jgi:hypothetical protein
VLYKGPSQNIEYLVGVTLNLDNSRIDFRFVLQPQLVGDQMAPYMVEFERMEWFSTFDGNNCLGKFYAHAMTMGACRA